MGSGAWAMVAVFVLAFGALGFVVFTMVKSVLNERSKGRSIFRDFGLGIALMVLFFVTWIGQGVAEWQTYVDEQHAHDQVTSVGDFVSAFSQSTLENWQSEFLQLFAFVSLAALYVHKGSAESKDSSERMEASLRRIEERLETLPDDVPPDPAKLPEPDVRVRSARSRELGGIG